MNNKKGFTLAEVLTTLMVIGVVAALTIPSMMNSYKKQAKVVKLKKAYSQLSQAMKMIPISKGCPAADFECAGFWELDKYGRSKLLSEQLKVANLNFGNDAIYQFTTVDGFFIYFRTDTIIYVDVDGKKAGPNSLGNDRFLFSVTSKQQNGFYPGMILPVGSREYATYNGNESLYWNNETSPKCTSSSIDGYCTGRILEEGKITYY